MKKQDETKDRVMKVLQKGGPMSPTEISVQELILPDDTIEAVRELEESGFVIVRDVPSSPDGKLVVISDKGLRDLEK